MKKIGILTRDCAGVNACIRSVVRVAVHQGVEVLGVMRGYEGLIDGDFKQLNRRSVSGVIGLGGTILKTARASRFRTEKWQIEAVKNIKDNNLDGLIVVGGNGSLTAAHILASKYGVPLIGIPATIDNDVNGVNDTIGADTAINVALDALDKIRDTATSLERIFVVEVMGRDCGYIALQVALAGGCEEVILPERDFDIDAMCDEITAGNTRGKVSWIIAVAEGKAKAYDIANKINEKTGLETREVVLGHVQRGGAPTAKDRILAARLGQAAVNKLLSGETDKCVTMCCGETKTVSLEEAVKPKAFKVDCCYQLIKILT
ncbi:MAG: 6-phosphofructokinase [Candidatus Omnitrophica bacterium]|nr:6-phosphofructokinase [Candidatus Omnitrophota bacterium]